MIDLYEIIFKSFDGLYTELLASKVINNNNNNTEIYGQLDINTLSNFKLS